MPRHDYAYPFRISPASGQAAQSGYEEHVEQMVRQVLLTDPGERIDLPEFGCGLRRLVFAPYSDGLAATTQLLVLQSLNRWLANEVQVQAVTVSNPDDAPDGQLLVQVDYVLLQTRAVRRTLLKVG